MKKAIGVFLLVYFLLSHICPLNAQHYRTSSRRSIPKYLKSHSGEFDIKLLNFTYKEPDVEVKDKGMMYGIGLAYTYHHQFMFKASLDFYTGKIDYKSGSGELNDVTHSIVELRCLIGPDFHRDDSPIFDCLTPYTGFCYRYWLDDSGGKITNLGKYGYDRETTYLYSPLGLEMLKNLENKWFIGVLIEFDLFWNGKNKSHLNEIDPSAPELEFDQDSGYGLRFAGKVKKASARSKVGIATFINYWHIGKSDNIVLYDPSDNTAIIFYEPENNTTEFGINFIVEF